MNKKILTIQDISCYGQCSITVALPILSAWGYETAILPSAILSTHTSGFKGFTVHDLSDEIPHIINHWKKEGIKYDALYSGYLGEVKHIDLVLQIKKELIDGIFILDPVMGDNGKLYPVFNDEYVKAMKRLIKEADIIMPNITEASLLTNLPYQEEYDKNYINALLKGLVAIGAKSIVLTGVSYEKGTTGVVIFENNQYQYYKHQRIEKSFHGTGDVFASTFIGSYLSNNNLLKAAEVAANFIVKCIKNTIGDDNHQYGVKFEPLLVDYISKNK